MTKFRLLGALITIVLFVFFANHCEGTEGVEKHKRRLQILQLELQRKILKAMDLYEEFSKSYAERAKGLKKLLGDTTYSEAVELFENGQTPHVLIPAESEWKKLVAHEQYRWLLRSWLDNRAKDNKLVQFELSIEDIDARIKIGDVLTKDDVSEYEQLRALVTEVNVPSARPVSQTEQFESKTKAYESIQKTMLGFEKGGTK